MLARAAIAILVAACGTRTRSAPTITGSGAIEGIVTEASDGAALEQVTVIAASPGLARSVVTDEHGLYKIVGLPPGEYVVTFRHADITAEHAGVHVGATRVTAVFQHLNHRQQRVRVHVLDTSPAVERIPAAVPPRPRCVSLRTCPA